MFREEFAPLARKLIVLCSDDMSPNGLRELLGIVRSNPEDVCQLVQMILHHTELEEGRSKAFPAILSAAYAALYDDDSLDILVNNARSKDQLGPLTVTVNGQRWLMTNVCKAVLSGTLKPLPSKRLSTGAITDKAYLCDLCSARIEQSSATVVPAAVIKQSATRGYVPSQVTSSLAARTQWLTFLNSISDNDAWALCPACDKVLQQYRPKSSRPWWRFWT